MTTPATAQPNATPVASPTARLAIVAALPSESAAAHAGQHLLTSDRTLSVVSGPGLAAARITAEELLETQDVQAVLSVGIAGGLRADLRCGDIVVSERVLRAGSDAAWTTDQRLRRVIERSLHSANIDADFGDSLTSARVLATAGEKSAAADTGAAIVQMEDSEWAEACASAGIPFCAVRVVIDAIDEDVPAEPTAWTSRPNPLVIATAIARRPGLARELLRLRLNLGRSLRALEETLLHIIPAVAADGR